MLEKTHSIPWLQENPFAKQSLFLTEPESSSE